MQRGHIVNTLSHDERTVIVSYRRHKGLKLCSLLQGSNKMEQLRFPEITHSSEGNGNSDENDDDDDDVEVFAEVLATARLSRIPEYVLNIRKKSVEASSSFEYKSSTNVKLGPPRYGTLNLVLPVEFSDGLRWAFRIPWNGTKDKFDSLSQESLTNESQLMKFLKKETIIPVPSVYAYEATVENAINCPFILMDYIEGSPLYGIWFDRSVSKQELVSKRIKCLEGIAHAMVQLSRFAFGQGGSLNFGKDLSVSCIGPIRHMDPISSPSSDAKSITTDYAVYIEQPLFSNPREAYRYRLNHHHRASDSFSQGLVTLLDLLYYWISKPYEGNEVAFILAHPDLNPQNVIVHEDGRLAGLIDWQDAGTVPRSVGNEAYPVWLTRDWDPSIYCYGRPEANSELPSWFCEDSPESLSHFRSVYERVLKESFEELNAELPVERRVITDAIITKGSLIAINLFAAASNPISGKEIAEKIVNEIVSTLKSTNGKITSCEGLDVDRNLIGEMNFHDICVSLATNSFSSEKQNLLKEGFCALVKLL